MKNEKLKLIIVLLVVMFVLSGCSDKKEQEPVTEKKEIEYIELDSKKYLDNNTYNAEDIASYNQQNNQVEDNQDVSLNKENGEEFTFFSDAKREISEYVNKEDIEKIREKGKYYVITGIDFIFYDQPINGVYFKDLTDDAKATVIKDVKIIDEYIMKYYPNYKEYIGSKYRVAADFVNEKYLSALESIKGYLGEKNYEALGEIRDQIKDDVIETKNKAVQYIKDKYNKWKNK